MAYATYNDFRGAVQLMWDGDAISSIIQPQVVDQMISLGEALVHYGSESSGLGPLRASSMESALAATVANNAAALPADCMELSIAWVDDGDPLDAITETDLRKKLNWSGGGAARFMAQAGDSVIFYPPVSDGSTLAGRYYAKPPALKDSLHATFVRYPEVYLYAALYSSAPLLGEDRRIPTWQAYYTRLLAEANSMERRRVHMGGSIRMRSR